MTSDFLVASKNFCKLFCVFCFARIRLDPLGSQVLHHDCISMIVSRFTSFTDKFVISCYQVSKIFCTRYDPTNTSSAQGPCDFGPLADLAIFGLSGSETKYCAWPNIHYAQVLKMVHKKNSRVSLCVQEHFHPQDSL